VNHTHEGSIGNLCNEEISEAFKQVISQFNFAKVEEALKKLVLTEV
jgi:argininosuccinate lyase